MNSKDTDPEYEPRRYHIVTSLPSVPVTKERPPAKVHHHVREAGIARANLAATEKSPEGTTADDYSKKHKDQTVLQQHVDFFDLNGDGLITPFETYRGFRAIGFNILISLLAMFIIHLGFAYVTSPSWIPDPLFRIYPQNIHRGIHGSDTNTFDAEGRFRPQMFQDTFTKYGTKGTDGEWGLTFQQSLNVVYGQRCLFDLFGISGALFEWSTTYLLIWPSDGVMKMEDVRGVYDGSYFYKAAAARRSRNN